MYIFYATLIIFFLAILLVKLLSIRTRRLKKYTSPLVGKIEVWQKPNGERVLKTNGFTQGISGDSNLITDSYWYFQAQQILKYTHNVKTPQALWLGLGAGTGPYLLAKENPKIIQTAIEFDSLIIKAAKSYFNLDTVTNLTVIKNDAYEEVKKLQDSSRIFDAIAVDIYTNDDPKNGKKLTDDEFLKHLSQLLRPKGVLIFNRLAHKTDERKRTEIFVENLKEMFGSVTSTYIKDSRGYENEVITVSLK